MAVISGPISPRPQVQSSSQRFKDNPALVLAQYLYIRIQHPVPVAATTPTGTLKIVCISDTHNTTPSVPDGDVLLHAGDLTNKGTVAELQAQLDWIRSLPHPYKIVIAGNHDRALDASFIEQFPHCPAAKRSATDLDWGDITFLNDATTTLTIRGRKINIFGSPLTPHCGMFGFQHVPIRDVWKDKVPHGTDILLTHGPPKGHLDSGGKGCEWLSREISRKKPRLMVFGHIHEGRGIEMVSWDYIERAYNGICAGETGFLGVIGMAVVLAAQWLRARVGWRRILHTTLVNAAVDVYKLNQHNEAGTVIEM